MRTIAFMAIFMTLLSGTSLAAKRDYLIYDSAKEYALAWGCSNLDVDFSLLNADENYRNEVLMKCDVTNYLINLYEDRIVSTNTEDQYFPTRYTNQNYFYVGLKTIDSWVFNTINTNGSVEFYTIEYAYKWQSSQQIMASVVPYNNGEATQSEIYTCTNCSEKALEAMLSKTGWAASKTESFAWNISFEVEENPKTRISYLVAKADGGIPKNSPYGNLKADIDLTFDYSTKTFSVKVAKLLVAHYED